MLVTGEIDMRHLAPLVALAAICACKSTAPYTTPAAAINTAAALGMSAQQRSQGGCYSTCTNGTACNPRTGYCEPISARDVCVESEGGGMRCAPMATPIISQRQAGGEAPVGLTPTLGVSPATGSVPPPPAEASPQAP
jgi:hypothetical protein